ncbi:hypothetical protein ACY2PI_003428 [Citrobacter amalonaticus]
MTNQVTDEDVTQGDSDRILSTTTFRYDTLCRLVEAKNNDATVTCEYDDAGRITAEPLTANTRNTATTRTWTLFHNGPPAKSQSDSRMG